MMRTAPCMTSRRNHVPGMPALPIPAAGNSLVGRYALLTMDDAQRLKGFNLDSFLDSKIAEEQAKQAQQSKSSPSGRRTPSSAGARRSSARTESPNKRPSSRLKAAETDNGIPVKGPDPEDFVIGDDASDISRATTPLPTPQPVKESSEGPIVEEKENLDQNKAEIEAEDASPAKDKGKEMETATEEELPEEVRKKLARLEALTTRYQGMLSRLSLHRDWHLLFYSQNVLCTDLLRNYRTAHARVTAIEPFEATLREHTPLTSIADPGALVEFLNQRGLQNEMVMEELKRVSAENREVVKERDELKAKLEEAEKRAKEAFDEAAGLRTKGEDSTEKEAEASTSDSNAASKGESTEDETFFSYETELPRLEAEVEQYKTELQEQKEYVNEILEETATLREAIAAHSTTELNLNAMENKIGHKDRELAILRIELDDAKERLAEADNARQDARELEGAAEEELKRHQQEHEENLKNGTYVRREEKMKEIHQNVVNALKDQAKHADESKRIAEGRIIDLELKIKTMESEADARAELTTRLRGHQDAAETWKKKASDAEHERDEAQRVAESKKGHEAQVASLRSQLKRAEKDRDAAYQMIIDCGQCTVPENGEDKSQDDKSQETPSERSTSVSRSRGGSDLTEQTEVSTPPIRVNTPTLSVDGEPAAGESKKKKKKKSKAKKKDAGELVSAAASPALPSTSSSPPSIEELIANPERANEILSRPRDDKLYFEIIKKSMESLKEDRNKEDADHEELLRHHEGVIEELNQTIHSNAYVMKEKDDEISVLNARILNKEDDIEKLNRKLRGDEDLREEIETLKEAMIEAGSESTDAKHELKELRVKYELLQEEYDDLQVREDKQRKAFNEARKELESAKQDRERRAIEVERLRNDLETLEQAKYEVELEQDKLKLQGDAMAALRIAKEACEKENEELKAQQSANGAELDAKHKTTMKDLDELKSRASGLETDLAAANQLAQSRFKDVTDLKERLSNVQAELRKVKQEAEELKTVKADLEKANAGIKKLESKERDLKSEIAEYKSQISAKDKEISTLSDKAKKSEERTTALEDTYEKSRKDLEQNERTRDEAVESRDKAQADLKKVQDELRASKSKLDGLEKEVTKFRDDASGLREQIQLKSAQQQSAQSMMDSMSDQTRELATQMKEIKERNENLEEELSDAHRLLSERGREGETMRRLLADVEGRAESKVKEMRERMDLTVEERDRAEDEASSIGRRKAREIEDLKTKLRSAEQEASRAGEAREAVEKRERDFKGRQEDLEQRASQAQEELNEVRSAMAQLRDALDEGERQSRELEKEKADLRQALDKKESQLEKLQKSSKAMAEELRTLQATHRIRQGGSVQSSRSSIESSRVTSPVPRGANGTPTAAQVDYAYLKNVLLQFLEQKEKKYQMQLVPVLGKLLHFDA